MKTGTTTGEALGRAVQSVLRLARCAALLLGVVLTLLTSGCAPYNDGFCHHDCEPINTWFFLGGPWVGPSKSSDNLDYPPVR